MMNYKKVQDAVTQYVLGVTPCDIVNLALMQYCVQFIPALLMYMVHFGLSFKYPRE